MGPQNSSVIPWDFLAALLNTDSPFLVKISYAFISSPEIGIKWVQWHFKSSYEHLSAEQFLETEFCGSALDIYQCVAHYKVHQNHLRILLRAHWFQRRWGLDFPAFSKKVPGMLILVNRDHTECQGLKWGCPKGLSTTALYQNNCWSEKSVSGFEERPERSACLTSFQVGCDINKAMFCKLATSLESLVG